MSTHTTYNIWFQYTADRADKQWSESTHSVTARSIKEANSKMRRKFKNAGFSSMRMIAIPFGEKP